jgi:hypothetical protein
LFVLIANFTLAQYNVLERSESFYTNRPTGVELVGGDANFGTQTKLEAVGKSGAGVDHHAGGIDLTQKSLRMHVIAREDGIGVMA